MAEVFAREGARVLVVNRSPEAGQAATDGIVAEGFEASFLQAEVMDTNLRTFGANILI